MASPVQWLILTGEYPPQPGGVSDHCRLVAEGLARAGDTVEVWAPPVAKDELPAPPGLTVCRLPDRFGPRSMAWLCVMPDLAESDRVLVQYVPQSFGWDTRNVGFCQWLAYAGRRRPMGIVFHEVAVDWPARGWPTPRRVRRAVHAAVTRLMAWLATRSARRIFISTPAWEPVLRPWAGNRPFEWLPMPGTVPGSADPARVSACRRDFESRTGASRVIGHFGTYFGHFANSLRLILPQALRDAPEAAFLLLGRGSEAFAAEFASSWPDLAPRAVAAGGLAPEAVSEHLCACDLLVQPYIDGITTRRSSAMASLSLGLPVLTNTGPLSEPFWAESGAVALAASNEEIGARVAPLLADTAELARLGAAGAKLYRDRFHLDRLIETLRSESAWAKL
jgi:glycosyltransferase involved in cell wall biosynthesis